MYHTSSVPETGGEYLHDLFPGFVTLLLVSQREHEQILNPTSSNNSWPILHAAAQGGEVLGSRIKPGHIGRK